MLRSRPIETYTLQGLKNIAKEEFGLMEEDMEGLSPRALAGFIDAQDTAIAEEAQERLMRQRQLLDEDDLVEDEDDTPQAKRPRMLPPEPQPVLTPREQKEAERRRKQEERIAKNLRALQEKMEKQFRKKEDELRKKEDERRRKEEKAERKQREKDEKRRKEEDERKRKERRKKEAAEEEDEPFVFPKRSMDVDDAGDALFADTDDILVEEEEEEGAADTMDAIIREMLVDKMRQQNWDKQMERIREEEKRRRKTFSRGRSVSPPLEEAEAPVEAEAAAEPSVAEQPVAENDACMRPGLLKEHQLKVINYLREHRGAIAAYGVGTGKTLLAIGAGQCFLKANPDKKVIFVGPASIVPTRVLQDMDKFGVPQDMRDKYVFETFDQFEMRMSGAKKPALDCKDNMLIIDEAHNLRTEVKGDKGAKPRAALKCAGKAKRLLLLTATPVVNDPGDLNNLIAMVKGIEKPMNLKRFKKLIEEGDVENAREILGCVFFFHSNPPEDPTDADRKFPSKTINFVKLPMVGKMLQEYLEAEKAAKKKAEEKQDDDEPKTTTELIKLVKLSNNPRSFYNAVRMTSNAGGQMRNVKLQWIIKHLKDQKNKDNRVIIFSSLKKWGTDMIRQAIENEIPERKDRISEVRGEMSKDQRAVQVAKYNSGENNTMIITPAGGEGLDMKRTQDVIIMEPDWNESNIEQVIGRAVRYESHADLPNDQRHVNIYRLVALKPDDYTVWQQKNIMSDPIKMFESMQRERDEKKYQHSVDLYITLYSISKEFALKRFLDRIRRASAKWCPQNAPQAQLYGSGAAVPILPTNNEADTDFRKDRLSSSQNNRAIQICIDLFKEVTKGLALISSLNPMVEKQDTEKNRNVYSKILRRLVTQLENLQKNFTQESHLDDLLVKLSMVDKGPGPKTRQATVRALLDLGFHLSHQMYDWTMHKAFTRFGDKPLCMAYMGLLAFTNLSNDLRSLVLVVPTDELALRETGAYFFETMMEATSAMRRDAANGVLDGLGAADRAALDGAFRSLMDDGLPRFRTLLEQKADELEIAKALRAATKKAVEDVNAVYSQYEFENRNGQNENQKKEIERCFVRDQQMEMGMTKRRKDDDEDDAPSQRRRVGPVVDTFSKRRMEDEDVYGGTRRPRLMDKVDEGSLARMSEDNLADLLDLMSMSNQSSRRIGVEYRDAVQDAIDAVLHSMDVASSALSSYTFSSSIHELRSTLRSITAGLTDPRRQSLQVLADSYIPAALASTSPVALQAVLEDLLLKLDRLTLMNDMKDAVGAQSRAGVFHAVVAYLETQLERLSRGIDEERVLRSVREALVEDVKHPLARELSFVTPAQVNLLVQFLHLPPTHDSLVTALDVVKSRMPMEMARR